MAVALRTRVWGLLFWWGPLLLWWFVILGSGGDTLSAGHTSRFVEPFVRWFVPDVSEATLAVVHVALRKLGHVSAYSVVGLLAFRSVRAGRKPGFRNAWAWTSLAVGTGLATTDEIRQSFVASRSGTLGDVAIDVVGCGAALICLAWWWTRSSNLTNARLVSGTEQGEG